ncbi:hypothetical protein [Sinorhizobium mexicanum]|uniref:hypothetical protein n=1 Tax=Sinorhizobium mexicanum TaxID=375549 RepID=UPI0015DD5BF0|nr:hypothetical protein [Sinorhizobium mexicanum]MBP1886334.1 hypothetical protein [Sinorhizobium mexicanum]
MTKHHAKDTLLIQTTGLEIELELAIDCSVSMIRLYGSLGAPPSTDLGGLR